MPTDAQKQGDLIAALQLEWRFSEYDSSLPHDDRRFNPFRSVR